MTLKLDFIDDWRGWLALIWIGLGGFLFWRVGTELSSLYPALQTSRGELLEGAALRFSLLPIGMLVFFVLFRDWFEQSGLRLLMAGVQWLVLALSLTIILKQPWELYGIQDLANGYIGGPYTLAPAGIVASTGVFLLLMLGTLLITDTHPKQTPRWEKWLEYSPFFAGATICGIALFLHEVPVIP